MTLTALITGITGQDGYYLSRLLLDKGYRVVGLVPPERQSSLAKLDDVADKVKIYSVAPTSADALSQAMETLQPDEIYNLAAPSFVPASWDDPSRNGLT